MHLIYVAGRLYPFLAAALVVALYQMGIYHRRRKSPAQFIYWLLSGILILSAILWVVYRGDMHSDEWLNSIFL